MTERAVGTGAGIALPGHGAFALAARQRFDTLRANFARRFRSANAAA
jgi:hypothetical protein